VRNASVVRRKNVVIAANLENANAVKMACAKCVWVK
jgi:hypothetical protein